MMMNVTHLLTMPHAAGKNEGQQREDGYRIGHSHLNEMLSFKKDASV